jgi:hypothetical protein
VTLSKGERIGIWVGVIVALLLFLLDPKAPWERISICVALFIFAVLLVADSEWAKQRSGNLSLFVDAGLSERISTPRFISSTLTIGVAILAFAVITWPPKEVPLQPFSGTVVVQPTTSTDPPSKPIGIPNPPDKVAPKPNITKGAPTSKPQKPQTKPVPESKPHPIIVVSKTTMTTNPDTKKIDIAVTLANLSSVEANVHLLYDMTWKGEALPGTVQTREVAFAPAPFSFELDFTTTPMGVSEYELENKIGKLSVIINATYPDQGGRTTYSYQGDVIPNGSRLDDVATSWTPEPAKP